MPPPFFGEARAHYEPEHLGVQSHRVDQRDDAAGVLEAEYTVVGDSVSTVADDVWAETGPVVQQVFDALQALCEAVAAVIAACPELQEALDSEPATVAPSSPNRAVTLWPTRSLQ